MCVWSSCFRYFCFHSMIHKLCEVCKHRLPNIATTSNARCGPDKPLAWPALWLLCASWCTFSQAAPWTESNVKSLSVGPSVSGLCVEFEKLCKKRKEFNRTVQWAPLVNWDGSLNGQVSSKCSLLDLSIGSARRPPCFASFLLSLSLSLFPNWG